MMAKTSASILGRVMDAFGGGGEGRSEERLDAMTSEPAPMMDLLAEAPMEVAEDTGFAAFAPAPGKKAEARAERRPEPLSALALRQQVDGSFRPIGDESVVQATIAALGRLLDAGNTDATGTWRRNVAKAARWLLDKLPTLTGAEKAGASAVLERWAEALGTDAAKRKVAAARI